MKSVNIKLSLAENVKSFVNIVCRHPYDVDLRAGRHVVDAKSIPTTAMSCWRNSSPSWPESVPERICAAFGTHQ